MSQIGQWLKEQRLMAGMSQRDAAEGACVSVDTIHDIEAGNIYPFTNHFEKLCSLFEVTPFHYYGIYTQND